MRARGEEMLHRSGLFLVGSSGGEAGPRRRWLVDAKGSRSWSKSAKKIKGEGLVKRRSGVRRGKKKREEKKERKRKKKISGFVQVFKT